MARNTACSSTIYDTTIILALLLINFTFILVMFDIGLATIMDEGPHWKFKDYLVGLPRGLPVGHPSDYPLDAPGEAPESTPLMQS